MKLDVFSQLKNLIAGQAEVGLAAHNLGTGEEILLEPDVSFHPASIFKVCVMMETFRQARQGLFSLDDPMRIKNEFASIADGSSYSLSVEDDSERDLYEHIGEPFLIRELVFRMITVSSNLATNLLMERLSPQKTTQFIRELGTNDVVVRRGVEDNKAFRIGLNNAASARGMMQILLKLAKGEVVSKSDSEAMIEILLQQKFNEMIPAQLPAEVRVAHKTGWNDNLYHDVGILYPPDGNAFVLAIMTKGIEKEQEAHPLVASLAKRVYDYWLSF
ncbi:MAG TPA: serine hydrolase [Anaerolineales bacterium]|nr:serine hydrolase [Anaerolineales bacterium]